MGHTHKKHQEINCTNLNKIFLLNGQNRNKKISHFFFFSSKPEASGIF